MVYCLVQQKIRETIMQSHFILSNHAEMHLIFFVTLHKNGQKSAEYQMLATVAICIQFFQQIFKRNIVQRHSNNSVS